MFLNREEKKEIRVGLGLLGCLVYREHRWVSHWMHLVEAVFLYYLNAGFYESWGMLQSPNKWNTTGRQVQKLKPLTNKTEHCKCKRSISVGCTLYKLYIWNLKLSKTLEDPLRLKKWGSEDSWKDESTEGKYVKDRCGG